MRKLFLSFALILSVGAWANYIYYTATEGFICPDNAFDVVVSAQAYNENTKKGSFFFNGNVTEIRAEAFKDRSCLLSIELPITIRKIADDAFSGVGTVEQPVQLILPDEWELDNLPMNSQTLWHGGYFSSERTFEPYLKAALKEIDDALGEDAESDLFKDFVAYYKSAIGNANKSKFIDGVKDAALHMISIIKSTYTTGVTDGKAQAKEALPTDPEGTEGTAVEITKGEKSITLINPDKVTYLKLTKNN